MSYLILPPQSNVLAGRTVTPTVGVPDTDHPISWLTDLRPAFPIRFPAGAWGVSISVATQSVQLIALANHSLDATVTLGGSVSGSILIPTAGANDVRNNPFKYYTNPVTGVTTITMAGTNTGVTIIGEAFAGVPYALTAFQMADMHDEFFDGASDLQGDFMNIPAHDEGREWRVFGGTQVFTDTEKNNIIATWQGQRGGSQPTLLVVSTSVNDVRVVQLGRPHFSPNDSRSLWKATLVFVEYPRYRWS